MVDKDAVKKGAGTKFTGTIEYFAFQAAGRKASEDFVKRSLGYLDGRVVGSEPLVKRPVDIEVQKISGGYLYTFLFDGVGFSVVIPRHSVANE